ncbi:MAG: endonuclease/exonuclease/phosphatase family protein [Candidatus Thorarchaeota archaeon]
MRKSYSILIIVISIMMLINCTGSFIISTRAKSHYFSSSMIEQSSPDHTTVTSTIKNLNSKSSAANENLTVFKLLTYNILDSGTNGAWFEVAKEENADIIVAVETGLWDDNNNKMLNEAITTLNTYFPNEDPYEGYTLQDIQGTSAGQAVLSRFPIIDAVEVRTLEFDDGSTFKPYYELLDVVVDIGGTSVHIAAIHLKCCGDIRGYLTPIGTEATLREEEQEGIINYFDSLGSVPIIYAGDFNSNSPFDVGDLSPTEPSLGVGPISMLLNSSNPHASTIHKWVDVYRELNPTEKGYTYEDWEYRDRIDFIFANDFFFDKLVNSTVASTPSGKTSSDHYSLNAVFNMDAAIADLRPPFKVVGLNGTKENDSTIQLTWTQNPESDLSHYNIYRDGSIIAQPNSTSYRDSNLTTNEIHRFHVTAVDNSANEGLKSVPLIVNTTYGIYEKPNQPKLTATSGIDPDTSFWIVTLTWTISNDEGLPITGFYLYKTAILHYAAEYEFTYRYHIGPKALIISRDLRSFVDKSVSPDRSYSYFLSAVNELGEGEKSIRATTFTSYDTENPSTTSQTSTKSTPFPAFPSMLVLILVPVLLRIQQQNCRRKK